MSSVRVRDLRDDLPFGAIIEGADWDTIRDPESRRLINAIFEDRGMILFRGSESTPQFQVALSEVFGPLKDHPTIAQAFVTEQLKAIRQLYGDDDTALGDLVKKYLPDVKNIDVLKSMVQSKLWYANGGLSGPGLQATLQGFSLTQTPDQLQDTTSLDAALQAVGKSDLTQY